MPQLSPYQQQVLAAMDIDVWQSRQADGQIEPGQIESGQAEPGQIEPEQLAAPPPPAAAVAASVFTDSSPAAPAAHNFADLDALQTAVTACQRCGLHRTRTHSVPGEGPAGAQWMFIGEAPGQNEDMQGRPFVGRAGKLLDSMIAALRMQRQQVYIANVIKCRPPSNRDPTPAEVAECEPYLQQQLALVQPQIIIVLGRVAAQALLNTTQPLSKLRGQVHHYGARQTPMIVTYHPAYLLRSPEQKAKAWDDLWQARQLVV